MTNGKRNRTAGHNWEREIVKDLQSLGFTHVCTSRSESKSRDDQKIDIINKNELLNGRLPYNIQAKCTTGHLKYGKVLAELPDGTGSVNVIFHKQTEKAGNRFVTVDNFAIMYLEDFYAIIKKLKEYESRNDGKQLVQPPEGGDGTTVLPETKRRSKTRVPAVRSETGSK
jgi:hypothetical protein